MKYLLIVFAFIIYTSVAHAQATTTGTNDDFYCSNTDDVTDGLVLWWPGRHQGMNYAQDVSQYKVQGTITGASWGLGRGLRFDGVNDYVSFGSQTQFNFGTNSFSISLYYKPGTTTNRYIISKGAYTSPSYSMEGGVGGIRFRTYIPGGYSIDLCGTIPINKWIHLVAVCDRSSGTQTITLRGYNNGQYYSTWGTSTSYDTSNSESLKIGCDKYNASFTLGNISDVRLYNRALNNDEVNRIYVSNPY